MQRGGCGDFKETVRLQEKGEDGHEGLPVPSGDVHRVSGAADEAIALPRQSSEAVALSLGDLIESRHTDRQTDVRRPIKENMKMNNINKRCSGKSVSLTPTYYGMT